jgi:hypothetical protein
MFDNGIPKHILEGGLGRRRPTGKPRNRWEGKLWKDGTKLFNMKNWHAMARLRSDCGRGRRRRRRKKKKDIIKLFIQ